MNPSPEVILWLLASTSGVIASLLALRLAMLVERAVRLIETDPDIRDGVRHMRITQILRIIGWSTLLVIGIIALAQEHPILDAQTPPVGFLLRWLMVGVIGVAAFETAGDFSYSMRMWRRRKTMEGAPTER